MTRCLSCAASAIAVLLGGAQPAEASNPVKWQVSVGPEAVLTGIGGGRVPFSPTSNPCPALRPTELFPAGAAADRKAHTLRGEVRVYLAVLDFAGGGKGEEWRAYEVTVEELALERAGDGGEAGWRIPDAAYADLLARLKKAPAAPPKKK